MKTIREQILAVLQEVRRQPRRGRGICGNVWRIYAAKFGAYSMSDELMQEFIHRHFPHWPKYSGFGVYPVPHPEMSPVKAYSDAEDKWDRETEYGRNRWELLDFIIAEVEKELQEES